MCLKLRLGGMKTNNGICSDIPQKGLSVFIGMTASLEAQKLKFVGQHLDIQTLCAHGQPYMFLTTTLVQNDTDQIKQIIKIDNNCCFFFEKELCVLIKYDPTKFQ